MTHQWQFFRAGGVDQVSLRDGNDLATLPSLDQKLWVALAMPNGGVDIDPATLALLDFDHDGRIRVPDVVKAVQWIVDTLRDPGDVLESADRVELAAIQEGKVLAAAKRILTDLGKPTASAVTLADTAQVGKAFANTRFNGDGVVIPATADDAAARAAIEDAIATVGSRTDRSGLPGVDAALIDAFGDQVAALRAWYDRAAAVRHPTLGDATEAAADALAAIAGKLDDYFARCRLAAFDPRAAAQLGGSDDDFAALRAQALTSDAADIARLPLAAVRADGALSLRGPANPAWAARLRALVERAVTPLLGPRDALTADDLAALRAQLAPFEAWRGAKPAVAAATLDRARVLAITGGDALAQVRALIAKDLEVAPEYEAIADVEKLVRFQRDLGRVLRNFVNFADFYTDRDGTFQSGTLHLDARATRLCVEVLDAAKHTALAGMSGACLAYCDITRDGVKKSVAAAFTNGDSDFLFVGRNGIYYDRKGDSWDATITRIVSAPISLREAFWSPYKKLARMIEEQVAKRAQAAEAAADARLQGAAAKVATADQAASATTVTAAPPPAPAAPPAAAPAAPPKKVDVGTVAAIGVAIGGIGAMVVGILTAFLGLGWWMPIGLAGLTLVISGPSMLLAWLKLRQRNLGPLLDANGWAINTRARVNVPFGAALTELPRLPPGSRRSLEDPYAERSRPWRLYAVLAIVAVLSLSWYLGKLDKYLPAPIRSTTVLGKNAPGA